MTKLWRKSSVTFVFWLQKLHCICDATPVFCSKWSHAKQKRHSSCTNWNASHLYS